MKGARQGRVDARGIPQPYAPDNPGGGGVGGRETTVQPGGVGSQEVAAVSREQPGRPQRQGRSGCGSHRRSARGVMIQMLRLDPSQAWIYHSVTVARRQWSEEATQRIPTLRRKAKGRWERSGALDQGRRGEGTPP